MVFGLSAAEIHEKKKHLQCAIGRQNKNLVFSDVICVLVYVYLMAKFYFWTTIGMRDNPWHSD